MKKMRLSMVLLMVATVVQLFAYTAPEAGKVYRIYNSNSQKVISEDGIARQLQSADVAGSNDYKQLWLLIEKGSGYLMQNAYSGQYIQHNPQQSVSYTTGTEEATMYIKNVSGTKYTISQGSDAFFHSDPSNNIVRWWDSSSESSQWQFEEVKVSGEAIALQQAAFQEFYKEYQAKLELMNHIDEYNALLPTFFTDLTCTELLPSYAAMDDEALRTAMAALPASLQALPSR